MWLSVGLKLLPGFLEHEATGSITTPFWRGWALVYHRIPSMKWLGVLLLLPEWDVSPSENTQHKVTRSIASPPWMPDPSPSWDTQYKVTRDITTAPRVDSRLVCHRVTSIKWIGVQVLLLPSGWDASPLQCYPKLFCQDSLLFCLYPFIHLRETMWSKLTCLRKLHNTVQRPCLKPLTLWSPLWKYDCYFYTACDDHYTTMKRATLILNLSDKGDLKGTRHSF